MNMAVEFPTHQQSFGKPRYERFHTECLGLARITETFSLIYWLNFTYVCTRVLYIEALSMEATCEEESVMMNQRC